MSRTLIWALVLASVAGMGLSGCGDVVSPAGFARDQPRRGGSLDATWHDSAARCLVVTTFSRISCRAVIRRLPGGSVRLALLADEGVLLADLTCDGISTTVTTAIPDLLPIAPRLGWFVHQTWGEPKSSSEPIWRDGHWLQTDLSPLSSETQRHFGGDPLLLRRVESSSVSISVGDYRPWGMGLLAHRSGLSALGFAVTLTLGEPRP